MLNSSSLLPKISSQVANSRSLSSCRVKRVVRGRRCVVREGSSAVCRWQGVPRSVFRLTGTGDKRLGLGQEGVGASGSSEAASKGEAWDEVGDGSRVS